MAGVGSKRTTTPSAAVPAPRLSRTPPADRRFSIDGDLSSSCSSRSSSLGSLDDATAAAVAAATLAASVAARVDTARAYSAGDAFDRRFSIDDSEIEKHDRHHHQSAAAAAAGLASSKLSSAAAAGPGHPGPVLGDPQPAGKDKKKAIKRIGIAMSALTMGVLVVLAVVKVVLVLI